MPPPSMAMTYDPGGVYPFGVAARLEYAAHPEKRQRFVPDLFHCDRLSEIVEPLNARPGFLARTV